MSLISLVLQPLAPAFVLALGGLLLTLGRRLARQSVLWAEANAGGAILARGPQHRLLRLRLPFALLVVLLAAALLIWLRELPTTPSLQWTWQPLTVAGSALYWHLDNWNWVAAGVIALLTAVALLLDRELAQDGEPTFGWPRSQRLDRLGAGAERILWLGAAALAFVCSGNVLTLATGWIVLDMALALRLRVDQQGEQSTRTWEMASLTGVLLLVILLFLGEDGIRTPLTDAMPGGPVRTLLWLAALLRAGVYPLHFWYTAPADQGYAGRLGPLLIGPAGGLWLLARIHAWADQDWLRRPEWAALGVLALLGTALVAWAQTNASSRWRWIALNRASIAVIVAFMAPAAGPVAFVGPLLTFALGCALLAAGQLAASRLGWRAPAWAAAVILWGMPGTAGFVTRLVLVFPTGLPAAVPLFALLLLAEILFTAALWQAAVSDCRSPAPPAFSLHTALRVGLAIALLAAPMLVWGLLPGLVGDLVSRSGANPFPSFGALLAGARRSVWAMLGLSAVLGTGLAAFRSQIFGQMRGWQAGIVAVADLEWLFQAVSAGLGAAAGTLRYFATLGEGEGYLGWLSLAALILWVLLRG